ANPFLSVQKPTLQERAQDRSLGLAQLKSVLYPRVTAKPGARRGAPPCNPSARGLTPPTKLTNKVKQALPSVGQRGTGVLPPPAATPDGLAQLASPAGALQ
ncbi:Hypothetical predicted protein, partial [Marmota monax]